MVSNFSLEINSWFSNLTLEITSLQSFFAQLEWQAQYLYAEKHIRCLLKYVFGPGSIPELHSNFGSRWKLPSFLLAPGEHLEAGILDVQVLDSEETLLLRARHDSMKVKLTALSWWQVDERTRTTSICRVISINYWMRYYPPWWERGNLCQRHEDRVHTITGEVELQLVLRDQSPCWGGTSTSYNRDRTIMLLVKDISWVQDESRNKEESRTCCWWKVRCDILYWWHWWRIGRWYWQTFLMMRLMVLWRWMLNSWQCYCPSSRQH